MTYIPIMVRVVDEVVPSGAIDKEAPDGMGKITSCYNCGSIVFYQVESLVENTKHAIDTCIYCAVCGKIQSGYINDPFDERESLKHEDLVQLVVEGERPQLMELGIPERTVLLCAFDYDVDEEGFVLDPEGNRIPSEEIPSECLKIENVMILPKVGGGLRVLDGTPTAMSKYLREFVVAED